MHNLQNFRVAVLDRTDDTAAVSLDQFVLQLQVIEPVGTRAAKVIQVGGINDPDSLHGGHRFSSIRKVLGVTVGFGLRTGAMGN